MPPGGKLKDEEIAAITEWVSPARCGRQARSPEANRPLPTYVITAEQRAFWAFQTVRKPAVPQVKDAACVRNPIDNFVLAKLEAQGLKPARPADKRILIRRATLDLTGLPPTPEEVDAFLKDSGPTPSPRWWTGCSRRRAMASAGAATGWTSPATRTTS